MQNLKVHHFPHQRLSDDQQGSDPLLHPAQEDQAHLMSRLSHVQVSMLHFQRHFFSHSVLPWKLSCTTPMASRKGWRFLRRGWEGPSTVCTTQKSWESPPDIGRGGQVRTRWSVVSSTQTREKKPYPGNMDLNWGLWTSSGTPMQPPVWPYQSGMCSHGGVTAPNISYEPVGCSR